MSLNLKPFNLERALAGDPVVTLQGVKVTAIQEITRIYPLPRGILIVQLEDMPSVYAYGLEGNYFFAITSDGNPAKSAGAQLMMVPKTRTVYVNFYDHTNATFYPTQETAKSWAISGALAVAVPVEVEF